MVQMKLSILKQFCDDESGATALEYGILIGLISLIIIGAMTDVADKLIAIFDSLRVKIDAAK